MLKLDYSEIFFVTTNNLFSNRSDKKSGDIFATIGWMVLSWAWAENTLAMTIGVINKYAGPIKGYAKPPLHMEKRISCLQAALVNIPALHSLKQSGDMLATRFTDLSKPRNAFMHGAATQLHDGSFESTKIGKDFIIVPHRFNQDDAMQLESELAELSDDATAFMLLVCDIFCDQATNQNSQPQSMAPSSLTVGTSDSKP